MDQDYRNRLAAFKAQITPAKDSKPAVDYATHKPTGGELNNICYLVMKYVAGFPMRVADFTLVQMMGKANELENVNDLDKNFLPALAQYTWDHLMGEPDFPTADEVLELAKLFREQVYRMDEKTRNTTSAVLAPKQ